MAEQLIFLFSGIILGILFSWILFRILNKSGKSADNVLLISVKTDLDLLKATIETKEREIIRLSSQVAERDANILNMGEKLESQKAEVEEIQERMKKEFRLMANEILNENSEKFTRENREKLDQVLKPFNENLRDFKKKVEETYVNEAKERFSLKEEVKRLSEMNEKISDEANALTRALKGDSKTQGIWGEKILERILESSGLEKGVDYFVQDSHSFDDGTRLVPDVIVRYPDKGDIIIDSKVSLIAYEQYVNSDDAESKELALKAHVMSIKKHIASLASKNYQSIYKENPLDFVMMFMPNEPAYFVALEKDRRLWADAYEKGILLISPTNLIAALRMIENIWRQVKQEKNVMEIAKQGGALYDKFVLVAEEIEKLGGKIGEAQRSYEETIKRIKTGKGNLIGRAEKIKLLGAKTKKSMPERFRGDELPE